MKKLLPAFMAACLLGGVQSLITEKTVLAQAGTGELRGIIKDKATGEGIAGATVVASSPVLQGDQIVITDGDGSYFVTALPPGMYTLTIYYNDATFTRSNVLIQLGKAAVVNVPISTDSAKGETVVIKGTAPIVDQGSTKTGVSLTKEYTNNVPVGRTFGAVLGTVAGSQGDTYGTSISGATSAENVYIIEGINTTDTAFGTQSTNLPTEFLGETEVITGGYNAEYGRATGGIINVTTKQGSDEFHGSVFGYWTPGQLTADAKTVLREGASIDRVTNRDYNWDLGAELGGPIIKKKLWFHIGINPSFRRSTVTRIVTSNVDKNADGQADVDPDTGFAIRDEVDRRDFADRGRTAYFTAKINGAISPQHQFQVSAFGNPSTSTGPFAGPFALTHAPSQLNSNNDAGAYDLSGKWTSKFNDGKTQIDAVVGMHRGFAKETAANAANNVTAVRYRYERSLFDFGDVEGYERIARCNDASPDDPYPMLKRNCPVTNYTTGGPGFLEQRLNDRITGVLSATQRVKALGTHVFKAGFDAELSTYDSTRGYSGASFIEARQSNSAASMVPQSFLLRQYLKFDEGGTIACGADTNGDRRPDFKCSTIDALNANTSSRSLGAYIQDSWQIAPYFTLNAGIRWEQQVGYPADNLKGTKSADTGETVPDEAFRLNNMLAPRVGFIFDPTKEGKAKLMGHWGRFYESVPLDINVRAFGGEMTNAAVIPTSRGGGDCEFNHGDDDIVTSIQGCKPSRNVPLGGSVAYFAPGTKGQYTEELILGGEFEVMPDLKLGVNYINRTLPRIIEDMSTDGGHNYFIGNPGANYDSVAKDLDAQAAGPMAKDPALAKLYSDRAEWLRAVKTFDQPVRNYSALQFTATQRPTRKSLLIGSYTYSRSRGNYPGLFSTETGQLDPNLTSMYDLPELMGNRYGATGLDRPHLFKVDGFYTFGPVMIGAAFRAQSGIPNNTLASHTVYGSGESFLLGRGELRRSPMNYNLDAKVQYSVKMGGDRRLEAFLDFFNLFNSQREADVDEIYSFQDAQPIIGGDVEDLKHAKGIDSTSPYILEKNKNYGKLSARQSPFAARLGVRFTF